MLSKRDSLKSSVRLRRRKRIETFASFLAVFLLILFGLAGLSQVDRFLIKKISISGYRTLDRVAVGNVVINEIRGRYFGLFPRNNVFLYRKEQISETLKKLFGQIKDVSIVSSGANSINIIVEERRAAFVWCEESDNNCYYADSEGLIFDRAPKLSNGVFLKFEGGLTSGQDATFYIGKYIMPTENLKMLTIFKQRTEKLVAKYFSKNWRIVSILISEGDDLFVNFENDDAGAWHMIIAPRSEDNYSFRAGDVSGGVLRGEGSDRWISFGDDLETTERNLDTLLSSKAFQDSTSKEGDPLQTLQYIDLRFGKKVFYKFD